MINVIIEAQSFKLDIPVIAPMFDHDNTGLGRFFITLGPTHVLSVSARPWNAAYNSLETDLDGLEKVPALH